ncbi:hypothetical protein OROGR_006886 [Orobanche gracilis]
MDHSSNSAEMQRNPNPNPVISYLQPTNYSNSYPYNLNSNPHQPTIVDPHNALYLNLNHPRPQGVDPLYVLPPVNVAHTQHPVSYEPQQSAASTAAANYQDPNAASYYQDLNASWLAAITQLGATSYAPGVTKTNPAIQLRRKSTSNKGPNTKQMKIVQSKWCQVCNICCSSQVVFDQHILGKKHLKNLENLKAKFTAVPPPPAIMLAAPPAPVVVSAPLPVFTSPPINRPAIVPCKNPAPIDRPTIGPEENPDMAKLSNAQKARKKAANARKEDLETKRRKVVEGGAAANAVRMCGICNVVCNSDTVFNFHLSGQKHAAMVRKYVPGMSVAPAT